MGRNNDDDDDDACGVVSGRNRGGYADRFKYFQRKREIMNLEDIIESVGRARSRQDFKLSGYDQIVDLVRIFFFLELMNEFFSYDNVQDI